TRFEFDFRRVLISYFIKVYILSHRLIKPVFLYPIANKKCTVKILLQAFKLQARKIFTSFDKYDNSN
ncbi:hypothetical protein, partial [Streptococcus sp. HMSC056C01]|uniref:hypothetical protein n=1 Tax=Streptococcus sp. HMSC056C01 TaxID=1739299 RepID=UPI001C990B61